MSSFWGHFQHWLHRKLSIWQLLVQPVMKISSKWQHFRFSEPMSVKFSPIMACIQDSPTWHASNSLSPTLPAQIIPSVMELPYWSSRPHSALVIIGTVTYCNSLGSLPVGHKQLQWRHMSVMAFRISVNSTDYSIACSGYEHRKYQGSELLAICEGIHRSLMALCEGNPSVAGGFLT